MNTPRDPEATVAAWLDEGPTELPGAARRGILTSLPMTPQARRGPLAPWRSIRMNVYLRTTVAVLVLGTAIVSAGALLNSRTSGGPAASNGSPGPTNVQSPAAPRPTPFFGQMTPSPLDGRAGFDAPFSYHLPAGAGLVAGESEYGFDQFRVPVGVDEYSDGIIVREVQGGRTDPCAETSSRLPLGDSRQIVDYLGTVPTLSVRDATPVTVDGRPGIEATLHVGEATADCQDLWLWDGVGSITQNGGRNTDWRIWLVDVRGREIYTRSCMCISVAIYTGTGADWLPLAESFVESLRFDSPRPSPTGG